MFKEMEMPCPCQNCNEWFDLMDGRGSKKWYPDTVICESCHRQEEEEIERDEEIEGLKEQIEDAESTLKYCRNRLKELGAE